MYNWINNLTNKPKTAIPVLVFLPKEPKGEQIQVKSLLNINGYQWCDTNLDYWVEDNEVSHWMSLPAKPKK